MLFSFLIFYYRLFAFGKILNRFLHARKEIFRLEDQLRSAVPAKQLLQAREEIFRLGNQLRSAEANYRDKLAAEEQTIIASKAQLNEQAKTYAAQIAKLERLLAEARLRPKINEPYYFGPYQWRVLEVQENKALLITEDVIAELAYDNKPGTRNNKWETCSLRDWLNIEDFWGQFTEEDQESIDGEVFRLFTQ